jgi:hypothetical protein
VRRRDLIALIIGAAAPWLLIATIVQVAADPVAGKLALIGVLANAPVPPLDGLREGLCVTSDMLKVKAFGSNIGGRRDGMTAIPILLPSLSPCRLTQS